jgi:hypothetical protein
VTSHPIALDQGLSVALSVKQSAAKSVRFFVINGGSKRVNVFSELGMVMP